jgi:hypothetical protein
LTEPAIPYLLTKIGGAPSTLELLLGKPIVASAYFRRKP